VEERCGDCCCCTDSCTPPLAVTRLAIATRLLAAKVRYDAAKAERDAAYDQARSSGQFNEPGVREIGVAWDEQIGYVLVEEGPIEVRIESPQALRKWTEMLGLTFRQVECALFSYRELGHWVDEATGETHIPPGVTRVRSSRPHLRVKPTSDAADTLRLVAVPAVLVSRLRAAYGDLRDASDSQLGECRDQVVEVAGALLAALPEEA
jgi:hypothetical protein